MARRKKDNNSPKAVATRLYRLCEKEADPEAAFDRTDAVLDDKPERQAAFRELRQKEAKVSAISTANRAAKRDIVTYQGRAQRYTEKAVLFSVSVHSEVPAECIFQGERWFPLSQCRVAERACGPVDEISVPRWLAEKAAAEVAV